MQNVKGAFLFRTEFRNFAETWYTENYTEFSRPRTFPIYIAANHNFRPPLSMKRIDGFRYVQRFSTHF